MNNIVLYSTHCPKCKILETKLKDKGVTYDEVNDVDAMIAKGMKSAPGLEVDGVVMDFGEAIKWVNQK